MTVGPLGYIVLLLITLAGIGGQWLGGGLESLWWYLTAALASAVWIEFSLGKKNTFRVRCEAPSVAALGVELQTAICIENDSTRPLMLESRFVAGNGLNVAVDEIMHWRVAARGHERRALPLLPLCLGSSELGTTYLRRLGMLKLIWWPQRVAAGLRITIVPQRLNEPRTRLGTRAGGASTSPVLGRGFELYGLRPYRSGDPMRAIDWKASARAQQPMVRLFTEQRQLEMILVVDCGRASAVEIGALSRLGYCVNSAAQLAEKACADGHAVGVILYAQDVLSVLPPGTGTAGLLRVRTALGGAVTRREESNPLAAALRAAQLVRHRTLMVILTHADEADNGSPLLKAVSLLGRTHLTVIASPRDPAIADLAQGESHELQAWFDPYVGLAAQELMIEERRAIVQLRAKGAHVVSEFPEQLASTLLQTYERLQLVRAV